MKNIKYIELVLVAVAVIAVITASGYAIFYFREKGAAIEQQNKEVADQASAFAPTISSEGISCDVDKDAQSESYSITIRTLPANISTKENQIKESITSLGGTVTTMGEGRTYDAQSGYVNYATITATLPISQANAFISQMKSAITSPEYTSNENIYLQDFAALKQTCQTYLDALNNYRSSEFAYLQMLKNPNTAMATTSLNNLSPMENIFNVRQNAASYKTSITNIFNQINKTNINITVKEIPG